MMPRSAAEIHLFRVACLMFIKNMLWRVSGCWNVHAIGIFERDAREDVFRPQAITIHAPSFEFLVKNPRGMLCLLHCLLCLFVSFSNFKCEL